MTPARATVLSASRRVRFGAFELNLQDRDLRKNGLRVKLQDQPFQVLRLLVETPGDVVTRDRLAQHLWPGLHVNFEHSLNTAVNALRHALSDSSRSPLFIETIPGLGYRFIAPVEAVDLPGKPRHSTGGFEAYQNYLKGRYFHDKLTEADLHKSLAYFEAVLAAEPEYALAYTGLADTYLLFAFLGVIPFREAHLRAKEYAMAALRIDPDLGEAHASLASLKTLCEWDWAGGEVQFLKALKLNPSSACGHHRYAAHLSAMGRHYQALQEIRIAQELDPLSLVVNMELAWRLYMARDFQASTEQSWKTLAMEPRFAAAQNTLGLAYEAMGMHEEAILEFQNARVCSDGHPASVAALAHAYAKAGEEREAVQALCELEQIAKSRYVSPYLLALVYCGLGRDDLAFEWLAKALTERDVWLVWLKVEPRFDRLQPDPRLRALLDGIGLSSSPQVRFAQA